LRVAGDDIHRVRPISHSSYFELKFEITMNRSGCLRDTIMHSTPIAQPSRLHNARLMNASPKRVQTKSENYTPSPSLGRRSSIQDMHLLFLTSTYVACHLSTSSGRGASSLGKTMGFPNTVIKFTLRGRMGHHLCGVGVRPKIGVQQT